MAEEVSTSTNKVAVCLYGNMNNWHLCKDNILNFFGKNADYFLYTSDRIVQNPSLFKKESDLPSASKYPPYSKEMLSADFSGHKLKGYSILPFEDHCRSLWGSGMNYKVQHFMEQALHLKRKHEYENDIEYDIVAFVRTDTTFMTANNTPIEWNNVWTNKQWIIGNGEIDNINWDGLSKPWDYAFIGTNVAMDLLSCASQYRKTENHVNSLYTHTYAEECMNLFVSKYNVEITHVFFADYVNFNTAFDWHWMPEGHVFDKDFITDANLDDLWIFQKYA